MEELLYWEVPTPDREAVCTWLREQWRPAGATVIPTPTGVRVQVSGAATELNLITWNLQRTTYLKVFRWGERPLAQERVWCRHLTKALTQAFPCPHPLPPAFDPAHTSIFAALADRYPRTVAYFQRFPRGEADLERVYWWEQRWRAGVHHPDQPQTVIHSVASTGRPAYDLIYVGGALGVIHAAVMARLGYRVLLIERLPFGRMNREWNISRQEFQSLIDLGLFTPEEFDSVIAREYRDGFHQFYWPNVPLSLRAPVLHTPTVLNICLDADKLLQLAGDKLRRAGGDIWDETEFLGAAVGPEGVEVHTRQRLTGTEQRPAGRLLVDAMGTASPIAWQLNGGRAFDSVCPTVGAVVGGLSPQVWDPQYGDVLHSHGDISRGRQLIWELFPGRGDEAAIYLFHYHRIHPDNPGSLLDLYEDFFTILPEYRRCDLDALTWIKPTFGYIPGHFSTNAQERRVAFDRLVAIGDAAALQSPLVFTGFGSLVRNLPRLTDLLDTALRYDLLSAGHLEHIRAYQGNTSVTWLFSKGMMVPTGRQLPPARINTILSTFFGLLAAAPPPLADQFIKDRSGWGDFTGMALRAARKNPALLVWIAELAGWQDLVRWLGSYVSFTLSALFSGLLGGWLPGLARHWQPWLERQAPALWFRLLAFSYTLTYTVGRPRVERPLTPELSAVAAPVESRP